MGTMNSSLRRIQKDGRHLRYIDVDFSKEGGSLAHSKRLKYSLVACIYTCYIQFVWLTAILFELTEDAEVCAQFKGKRDAICTCMYVRYYGTV